MITKEDLKELFVIGIVIIGMMGIVLYNLS